MAIYILGNGPAGSDCCGCAGRLDPCDAAPVPTQVCRTSEATLSKCGWDEFGTPSSPPKYYLTKTFSGSFVGYFYTANCDNCLGGSEATYSGSCSYAAITCNQTSNVLIDVDIFASDCSTVQSTATYTTCYLDQGEFQPPFAFAFTESTTNTSHSYTGTGVCATASGGDNIIYTGTVAETLYDEYTTAMLSSDVSSILPAYSGSYAGENCGTAFYDLDASETTISKRKIQYKFTLPSLTGYACYRITWAERFVPDGAGSTVYTSFTYSWNGSDSETPVYEMTSPATPGTTTVVSVAATCLCS